MKVLFLDIDGVLNSRAWKPTNLHGVDPNAVKRVQDIVAKSDAKVVLSSTWRLVDELIVELLKAGVPIYDKTPDLASREGGLRPRSEEIEAWLNEHPEVTEYAILDDDADAGYGGLAPQFIRIDERYGLQDTDAQKVLELLGVAP
jgi:hypothetical protein